MKPDVPPPIVLFLHLVNSGGLPLYPWLKAQYSWRALLPVQTLWGNPRCWLGAPTAFIVQPSFPAKAAIPSPEEQLADVDRTALRLVLGHFRYGLHRCFRRPAQYVTLLRDPVRRVLSYYFFLRRQHPAVLTTRRGACLSLEDWLESPDFASVVRNDQVRSIAGRGGAAWRLGAPVEAAEDLSLLDDALRNIDRAFRFVGIVERYDESVLLLSDRMGWGPLWYGWGRRRAPLERPPIPDRTEARVAELNAIDIALYQRARAAFDVEVAREGASFLARVERFRRINALGERRPFHFR